MADEPKKVGVYTQGKSKAGGIPWWVWALIALLVIALLWWAFAGGEDEAEPVVVDPAAPTAVEPVEPGTPVVE